MKFFAIPLLICVLAAFPAVGAGEEDFNQFLAGIRRDAAMQGVPSPVIESALRDIKPDPEVIELDRKQPETTVTFDHYITRLMTPARVSLGRKLRTENRALLMEIARHYGVSAKTILALWAIESSYGHAMGSYNVVESLATLAFDGRRPDLFRAELISALKILEHGGFDAKDLKGSWAGAMGQTQFMPSTYLRYAVPYHHAGAADIWKTSGDVFASAANYLSSLGWNRSEAWGREVRLTRSIPEDRVGVSTTRTVSEWARSGVVRADGQKLRPSNQLASLVEPDGADGRTFLVYDNFRTIMKWNHSTYFALAVGLLGDAIGN